MINSANFTALMTLLTKEIRRFIRIWPQTFIPPVITMSLYFIIFGSLIGPRIGEMAGFNYMEFIAPGLIMMSVITNSYANVSSSFYSTRFGKSIEEMLVSPMPNYLIMLGFVGGGIVRALLIGAFVTVIALFFTDLSLHSAWITFGIILCAATLFSLAGFTNGIFARKFDDITIIPTFILTPLTYLGGVFYSIELLPQFWQNFSKINPILYIVDTFRYGILGTSDINTISAFVMVLFFIGLLFWFNLFLLKKGTNLRP